jgi:hypothetical protein
MCFGVMQALAGPDKAVTELLAATRPGGQVWIDALNRNALSTLMKRLIAWLRGRPLDLRYDDPRHVARDAARRGCVGGASTGSPSFLDRCSAAAMD